MIWEGQLYCNTISTILMLHSLHIGTNVKMGGREIKSKQIITHLKRWILNMTKHKQKGSNRLSFLALQIPTWLRNVEIYVQQLINGLKKQKCYQKIEIRPQFHQPATEDEQKVSNDSSVGYAVPEEKPSSEWCLHFCPSKDDVPQRLLRRTVKG